MGGVTFAASAPVILLGVVILLIAAWLSVLTWQRHAGRRWLTGLEAVRLAVIALVVLTLWQPELNRPRTRTDQPEIVILADASRSMTTQDVLVREQTVESRADWVERQLADGFWSALTNQYQVSVDRFATLPGTNATATAEEGTDLNAALEEAATRSRNLRAVILLSDGDWNLGPSPVGAATRLRVRDVPVFAVGVGSQQYLPDLAIERVSAPAYGLLGEQVFIGFTIRSHLPREIRTSVTLRDEWGGETARDIVVPALGQAEDAVLWTPLREGATRLTLELPVEQGELRRDNNLHVFPISIRKEILQVLVVDSVPRWEYRYLRNALSRDPGVNVETLLLHPGIGPGGGRGYLDAFPVTREALSKYDVVFLGDVGVGPGELSLEAATALKGLVEQQGSGLVFLPGSRGRQLSLLDTPLGELLPVELDETQPTGLGTATPSTLVLTQRGRGHLLTMLAAREEQNAQLWRQLPGFFWSAAVRKSKPGADVLAVHEGLRNQWGRTPLLVTRPEGNGKVLFMGIDSAWRWRRGVEDTYHYRFWGQVVRWMSYQRHLAQDRGFRVFYTPETPHRGETVRLHATLFDAAGAPLTAGRATAEAITPSGRAEQLPLTAVEGGWGVFEGEFTAREQGVYQVTVRNEETARAIQLDLLVRGEQREQVGRPARFEILKEIAAITRGAFGAPAEVAGLVGQIAALPESNAAEQRLRLWCHPLWAGLIIVLLAVYWVGRKVAGLV